MGEKGNDLDQGVAAVATAATGGIAPDPSVIERVTTTTTQTVVGTGKDALSSLKDKALDKGSEAVLDEARDRIHPKAPADGAAPVADPPTGERSGGDGARGA
jgi:hypothetical protein